MAVALYTKTEAALYCGGVTRPTIQAWIKRGYLCKNGKRIHVRGGNTEGGKVCVTAASVHKLEKARSADHNKPETE